MTENKAGKFEVLIGEEVEGVDKGHIRFSNGYCIHWRDFDTPELFEGKKTAEYEVAE